MKLYNKEEKAWRKFAVFVAIFFACMLVATAAGMVMMRFSDNMLLMQAVTSIIMFGLAAFEYGCLYERKNFFKGLFFTKVKWQWLAAALCVWIVGLPFIEAVSVDSDYGKMIEMLVSDTSIGGLVALIIVMALLPAVLEEWFFRGVLQRLFISWTKRVWVGLILASTVFSLIHFDLPNFFARFVLGMMLGMLYLYSGNIWTNITYHFINNAAAAISMWYCARQGGGCSDGFDFPVIVSVVSVLAVVACVFYCIRKLKPNTAFDELLTANEPMVETEGETMTEL